MFRQLTPKEQQQLHRQLDQLADRLWHRPEFAGDMQEVQRLLYLVGNVGTLRLEDLAHLKGLLALHQLA